MTASGSRSRLYSGSCLIRRASMPRWFFLAAVACLFFGGSAQADPMELMPQPPTLEGSIRSIEGTTVTSIEFINLTADERQIIWLDYSGKRVLYNVLEAGQSYVQSTFLTHPWLVADQAGHGLAIYLPIAQPGKVTLRPSSGGSFISPGSLDFGNQQAGTRGAAQTVTISALSRMVVAIGSIALGGANPGDFAITADSGQGTVLGPVTRTISIAFAPTAAGARRAILLIPANGVTQLVLLSGNGTPPAQPQPVLSVPQPVAHPTGVEFLGANPPSPGSTDLAALRGVGPDGSLLVQDWAGTALLSIPPTGNSPAQVLVDPSRPSTSDGVGIARLLRAEVSSSGTVALQALRADNNRAIYRLANGSLTLLGLLPGARDPQNPRGGHELAISDAGQVAYIANVDPANPASPLALFQTRNGAPVELLRQGQASVNGAAVAGFSDLTGNGNGDLAVRVALNGTPNQAVLRITGTGVEVLAKSADVVERGRGTGLTGALTELRRPLIGPDGTVVFLGAGSDFVNFYVARPGRPLQALLTAPGTDTSIVEPIPPPAAVPAGPSAGNRFDYEIAADGTVALQAALANAVDSMLLLFSPSGSLTSVVSGQRAIEPILRAVFGPGGVVFFLAEDQTRPTDRDGRFQVGLYRFRPGGTGPEPVAIPGDHIPTWSGDTRLLSLTQRPFVLGNQLLLGVVFGGPENLPVPSAAFFQVPLNGTLAEGTPAAVEGLQESDASRLAMLRELSYQADGTLVTYGLMPGAGPLIAPASSGAGIASAFHTQAAPAIVPLVAQGDQLGSGQLENIVPPLVAVGTDRELFGARTSQTREPDHEGLFTAGGAKKESVAMNRDAVPDAPGTFFDGFADTRLFMLSPSSVSPDGRIVFKSLLDRGGVLPSGQTPPFGVSQWSSGGVPSTIGMSDIALVPGDPLPYVLERWAAGPGALSFLLARTDGGKGPARLLISGSGPKPVAVLAPGTQVTGGTPLSDLTDFVLNRENSLFVTGLTAGGEGMFRDMVGTLVPLALQGMPVPAFADGTPTTGFTFSGSFQLLPATARGPKLLFRAAVQKPGGAARLGEFQWTADAGLQTRSIVGVAVNGVRTLTANMLGDTTLELQNGNGTAVSAYLSDQGSWVIVRSRVSGNSIVSESIAQDGKGTDATVRRFMVLDAGPLLDQEGLPPHSGPVFTLNDAGEVAILASDGKKWGIYKVPAP